MLVQLAAPLYHMRPMPRLSIRRVCSYKYLVRMPPIFRQFQISMHLFEIVRLCALWRYLAKDRESIRTVIALFNEPDLIERHIAEVGASVTNQAPPPDFNDGDDAELQSVKDLWWRGTRMLWPNRSGRSPATRAPASAQPIWVYSPRLKLRDASATAT